MSRATQIPYKWPDVDKEVRLAILTMASSLGTFGPEDDGATVEVFLGCPVGSLDLADPGTIRDEHLADIEFSRHSVHRLARASYDYAYQLDGWEAYTVEAAHEVNALLDGGYASATVSGGPTTLHPKNGGVLREIMETADARFWWTHNGWDLTVRQLSLLSGMSEATVRSTLSKEGFKLQPPSPTGAADKSAYTLAAHDAAEWLGRRRGFIPNRDEPSLERTRTAILEILDDRSVPFLVALRRVVDLAAIEAPKDEDIDTAWYAGLLAGDPVSPDVDALTALADTLGAPRALFAGRAVEHLVRTRGI